MKNVDLFYFSITYYIVNTYLKMTEAGYESVLSSDALKTKRVFKLFGYPISHSMAPMLHNSLWEAQGIPWRYELFETKTLSDCLPVLEQEDVGGSAVTMPFKVDFVKEIDSLSDAGTTIGSINTVYKRREAATGKLVKIGTNTDCLGIRDAFLFNYPGLDKTTAGLPGMVIGGGGTCRAAVYALWKFFGVSKIYLVNRLEHELDDIIKHFKSVNCPIEVFRVLDAEQAKTLEVPAIVISAVPDFAPVTPEEIQARGAVEVFLNNPKKGYLLEMCYHPSPKTQFYKISEARGWKTIMGVHAMVAQGVAQQLLWNEQDVPKEAIEKAYKIVMEKVESNH